MVRRYEDKDFEQVFEWGKSYGNTYKRELFPSVGFIVPGIAVYFLYQTDSKICFLESMVANPETSKEARDEALNSITSEILREARDRGFEVAYACSDIPAVVERAIRAGATFKPKYVLLQKQLS